MKMNGMFYLLTTISFVIIVSRHLGHHCWSTPSCTAAWADDVEATILLKRCWTSMWLKALVSSVCGCTLMKREMFHHEHHIHVAKLKTLRCTALFSWCIPGHKSCYISTFHHIYLHNSKTIIYAKPNWSPFLNMIRAVLAYNCSWKVPSLFRNLKVLLSK